MVCIYHGSCGVVLLTTRFQNHFSTRSGRLIVVHVLYLPAHREMPALWRETAGGTCAVLLLGTIRTLKQSPHLYCKFTSYKASVGKTIRPRHPKVTRYKVKSSWSTAADDLTCCTVDLCNVVLVTRATATCIERPCSSWRSVQASRVGTAHGSGQMGHPSKTSAPVVWSVSFIMAL